MTKKKKSLFGVLKDGVMKKMEENRQDERYLERERRKGAEKRAECGY